MRPKSVYIFRTDDYWPGVRRCFGLRPANQLIRQVLLGLLLTSTHYEVANRRNELLDIRDLDATQDSSDIGCFNSGLTNDQWLWTIRQLPSTRA